jgi:hypothetical protein
MSDQMEQPTENNVTERVINRKPYNFSPTPMKNSPGGATPDQEAAQAKYKADALATPEGQAWLAKQSPDWARTILRSAGHLGPEAKPETYKE